MINYIWFDLGLTLVKSTNTEIYKEILDELGHCFHINDIEKAYHYANKYYMRNYPGVLSGKKEDYIFGYMQCLLKFLGIHNRTEEFTGKIKKINSNKFKWRKFDFVDDVLQKLNAKGIKTGLISNWDNSCRMVLSENDLLDKLDTIVISSEVGVEKPSKVIFEKALEIANIKAKNCLYVGDNYYDDVIGASYVNMDCLLINPYDNFGIEELKHDKVIHNISEIFKFI